MTKRLDTTFLLTTIVLLTGGFFIFMSASLGLLTRDGASFSSVAASQILLGAGVGALGMFGLSRIHYKNFRRFALPFFIVACLISVLVFVPGIGAKFGGAHSWILLGPISFQPAELLKFAYIVVLSAFLANPDRGQREQFYKFAIFSGITLVAILLLALEPNIGTAMVLALAGVSVLFASGASMRYIALMGITVITILIVYVSIFSHAFARIKTYLDPSADPQGSGYQIQQALIAVGSGELFGRGFGQSLQKFNHLPEPIGDSIFAVFAEEFGFVGSLVLLVLFVLFALRGFRIAARAPDRFGALLVVGFISLILVQSLTNIAAVLGVLPLTGLPLIFISHGGSALLFALLEVGVILSVSRFAKV